MLKEPIFLFEVKQRYKLADLLYQSCRSTSLLQESSFPSLLGVSHQIVPGPREPQTLNLLRQEEFLRLLLSLHISRIVEITPTRIKKCRLD